MKSDGKEKEEKGVEYELIITGALAKRIQVENFDYCVKKYEVERQSWMLWSTLIFGWIGTPLVIQQLTWWFKVHLSRKAYVSRAMLISKLECWWTKFNVELSIIKLKSKVLTIALRTTKLNYKVECWSLSSQMLHSQAECCDLLWFLAGMVLHRKSTPWQHRQTLLQHIG